MSDLFALGATHAARTRTLHTSCSGAVPAQHRTTRSVPRSSSLPAIRRRPHNSSNRSKKLPSLVTSTLGAYFSNGTAATRVEAVSSAVELVFSFKGGAAYCFCLDPNIGEFVSTRLMKLPDGGGKTIYSCNEGNSKHWDQPIKDTIEYFKTTPKPYTARYVGSMVADGASSSSDGSRILTSSKMTVRIPEHTCPLFARPHVPQR